MIIEQNLTSIMWLIIRLIRSNDFIEIDWARWWWWKKRLVGCKNWNGKTTVTGCWVRSLCFRLFLNWFQYFYRTNWSCKCVSGSFESTTICLINLINIWLESWFESWKCENIIYQFSLFVLSSCKHFWIFLTFFSTFWCFFFINPGQTGSTATDYMKNENWIANHWVFTWN